MTYASISNTVTSFYQDIWNKGDKSKIPLLLCEGFTFRGSLGMKKSGHAGFASYVDFVHQALADYRCELLDLVVEPPKAFVRLRFSGVHQGVLFDYAPTGMPVSWEGSALFTFEGEQVADLWVLGDVQGLLVQLEHNALQKKSEPTRR